MMHVGLSAVHHQIPDNSDVFLQSTVWGEFKKKTGWHSQRFEIHVSDSSTNAEYTGNVLVLVRRIARFFSLVYIPYPVLFDISPYEPADTERLDRYRDILTAVSRALRKELAAGCIFIRYDMSWSEKEHKTLPDPHGTFRKAPMDIQPPSTVILDLTGNEEKILASMKQKTRYNIRLAEKKGVEVLQGTIMDLDAWYALYRETAVRDKISLHGISYYKNLFLEAEKRKESGFDLRLLLARHEGCLIAGIILCLYRKRATYLYGASSDAKRNLMPAYALQWHAIKLAREAGCITYDLFGIPPNEDPSHPMAGLYRFKTGFGGLILHKPGCWDFPLNYFLYTVYCLLEKTRKFYYKNLKKAGRNSDAPGFRGADKKE